MTIPLRLAALAAAAALAACGSTPTTQPTAALAEPSAVAVFRGVTPKSADVRPYIAVANAATNDLTIVDATDDTLVEAPAPLRGLVYPVPGRPVLLASGDLGDKGPDLLVAVTAGDLPSLGGSRLTVIRTWRADGSIAGEVELGGDVLALVALPPDPARDPAAPAQVKVAAALAGERIAVVTFERVDGSTAIDVDGAVVAVSGPLGFQPVDLAAIPGVPDRVWAASRDLLPAGFHGVAEIDVTGTPALGLLQLDALAPTRLVAALRLAEWSPPAGPSPDFVGTAGFGTARPERVYAVLDESGCGLHAPIGCGLVALAPELPRRADAGHLALDPTVAATYLAPYRAPIPFASTLALGAAPPPEFPPSPAEPQYAGTYMRLWTATAFVSTTGAAAVATADGFVTFVDLARWEAVSQRSVFGNVVAKVTPTRPPGLGGAQWLVLERRDGGGFAPHLDPAALSTAVHVTGGYTPTEHWTVTSEGVLPGLSSRRAEVGSDGALALQVSASDVPTEVVRLWDPTLGVSTADIVVIEPTGFGTTCTTTFEANVATLVPPDAARPGGAVTLAKRTPPNAAWDRCVDELLGGPLPSGPADARRIRATFRAGGYVLVRGSGTTASHVGRPEVGASFAVEWKPEVPLAASCTLPPAVPWPGLPASCTDACRADCKKLVLARNGRRVGYVTEPPSDLIGPALAFTLALEVPDAPVPRDLALTIDTADGRAPFRVGPTAGSPVDPRAVVPFDRSPYVRAGGVRFLVPYAGNALLDASPTLSLGEGHTIH